MPDSKRPENERKKLGEFAGSLEDLGDLPLLIDSAQEAMGIAAGSGAFSRDVLSIEISGPERPQLTVVDLPGLTHTENKSQSLNDVELVSELVHKYMSDPRTIILAIVTAKNDYANQIVLKRAKEVDPGGVRTLGIITKPDTLPEGSDSEDDFFSLAKNEDIFFELGWHVLRNRAYEERGSTFVDRNHAETLFFDKGVWKNLPRDCVGISALRSRLSALLLTRIKKELPRVYKEISNELKDCENQLSKLGQCRSTVYEQRVFLSKISEAFGRLCKAATDGIYEEKFFKDVTTTEGRLKRLRAVIQKFNVSFADEMRKKGHSKQICEDEEVSQLKLQQKNDLPQKITKKAAIEWVKPLLIWSRGRELPGTYNPLLIGELFLEQSGPWESLAYAHLVHIFQVCQKFLEILLQEVAPGDMLDSLFSCWINERMHERLEKASSELKSLLKDMSRHAITYNHYYAENIQRARQARSEERYITAINSVANWDTDVKGAITLDPAELLRALTSPNQANMDDFACEEVLDGMFAFYKVATKVFIDNVAVQVVERQVVGGLWEIFSPSSVAAMTAEMISSIAEESVEDQHLRKRLEMKLKSLQMGMEVCRGTMKGIKAGVYFSCFSTPVGIQQKLTGDTDGIARAPAHAASFEPVYFPSISLEELGALLADANPQGPKERININKDDLHRASTKPSTTPAAPENLAKTATTINRGTVAGNKPIFSGVGYTGGGLFGSPLWVGATAEIPAGAGLPGTPSGVTGKVLFGYPTSAGAIGAGGKSGGFFGNSPPTGATGVAGAGAGGLSGAPSAVGVTGVGSAASGALSPVGTFGGSVTGKTVGLEASFGGAPTITAKTGIGFSPAASPAPAYTGLFGGVPTKKKPPNT